MNDRSNDEWNGSAADSPEGFAPQKFATGAFLIFAGGVLTWLFMLALQSFHAAGPHELFAGLILEMIIYCLGALGMVLIVSGTMIATGLRSQFGERFLRFLVAKLFWLLGGIVAVCLIAIAVFRHMANNPPPLP